MIFTATVLSFHPSRFPLSSSHSPQLEIYFSHLMYQKHIQMTYPKNLPLVHSGFSRQFNGKYNEISFKVKGFFFFTKLSRCLLDVELSYHVLPFFETPKNSDSKLGRTMFCFNLNATKLTVSVMTE